MTEEDKAKLERYINSFRISVEMNLGLGRTLEEYAGRARARGLNAFVRSDAATAEDMIIDALSATFLARKDTF